MTPISAADRPRPTTTVHIGADALADFGAEAFEHVGGTGGRRAVSPPRRPRNPTGDDSHGADLIAPHPDRLRSGETSSRLDHRALSVDTPGYCRCRRAFGFGQTVAPQAVDLGSRRPTMASRRYPSATPATSAASANGRSAAAGGPESIHCVNAGLALLSPFGGLERGRRRAVPASALPRETRRLFVLTS